jgi:hypothetical protein
MDHRQHTAPLQNSYPSFGARFEATMGGMLMALQSILPEDASQSIQDHL